MDDRRKNYRAWDAQQGSQEPVSPRDARCPKTIWSSSCWISSRRWTSRPSTSITPGNYAANRPSTSP